MIRQTSRRIVPAVLAALMLAAPLSEARADKQISNTGAAILGGIAGVAIGAAIADNNRRRNPSYGAPGYQGYYPPAGYRTYYRRPFSPAGNVVCYPEREICYNNNGTVANKWTRRVFGY